MPGDENKVTAAGPVAIPVELNTSTPPCCSACRRGVITSRPSFHRHQHRHGINTDHTGCTGPHIAHQYQEISAGRDR
jgi:hypothetical protein